MTLALSCSGNLTVESLQDTQNTHRALGKTDVVGLQQQAQQKQSDNMLLLNTVTALADDGMKKNVIHKIRVEVKS